VVGAGSIVSKSLPDYAIAYGNPIKVRDLLFNEEQRNKLKKIEWWNFEDDELKEINTYFYDVDTFIKKYYSD